MARAKKQTYPAEREMAEALAPLFNQADDDLAQICKSAPNRTYYAALGLLTALRVDTILKLTDPNTA